MYRATDVPRRPMIYAPARVPEYRADAFNTQLSSRDGIIAYSNDLGEAMCKNAAGAYVDCPQWAVDEALTSRRRPAEEQHARVRELARMIRARADVPRALPARNNSIQQEIVRLPNAISSRDGVTSYRMNNGTVRCRDDVTLDFIPCPEWANPEAVEVVMDQAAVGDFSSMMSNTQSQLSAACHTCGLAYTGNKTLLSNRLLAYHGH